MRRRLILSTALISLAAVVVLGVPLGAVEAARLRQDVTARLEREADAAAGAIDDRLERHRPIAPSLLRRFAHRGHRITIDARAGRVSTGPPLKGQVLRAHSGSARAGEVLAEAPVAELHRRVRREWLLIAALGIGGVLMATALAALQALRLARPLEAIARRAAQLGDGDFSVRAGRFGVPEVDAIALGLDTSAGRIAELVAREREFSANVSHQLRTPLTALRLRIEEAEGARDEADRRRELEAALVETDRLEATIADLLAHARRRARADEPSTVDLAAMAREHVGRWQPVFGRAGRRLELRAEASVMTRAARGTVGQVLDVLLDNALHHGAGAVEVVAQVDGRGAVLAVRDEGPGVADAERDAIFERGASRTGGTGIGLHLARALAEADGGSLHAESARFVLRLPLVS